MSNTVFQCLAIAFFDNVCMCDRHDDSSVYEPLSPLRHQTKKARGLPEPLVCDGSLSLLLFDNHRVLDLFSLQRG